MARLRLLSLSGLLLLAGCETAPPRVAAPPPPATVAPPAPEPVALDWRDMPYSPGTWRYVRDDQGSSALYGEGFALKCARPTRTITMAMPGASTATGLTVRTTYGRKELPAAGGVATLTASDPLLDQIAFTRGRFSIEASGGTMLVMMPAWAEPVRVIEDCRG